MSIPKDKFPLEGETGDPKVNAAEQDVITNKDDTGTITNKDGAVADMDGITENLSGSEPSAATTADTATATDSELAHSDTATDAEVAGDDHIV